MRSHAVVIVRIVFQNPTQMFLVQDNDVVQTLAPDRSDQPFGKAVLPRRGRCNWLVSDAHGTQSAHSAVGLVVTPIQTRSLRSSRMMTKPYSSLKPMVGTTNKSMAAMSGAWFRRKVRHS